MYTHNPQDRVAIFIDGENIHYSAKHLNMRLDYLKLCSRLAGPRQPSCRPRTAPPTFCRLGKQTLNSARF